MKSRSFLWPVMLAGAWMAAVSVPSLIAVDQPSLLPGVQVLATDPVAAEEGMDPATFTLIRSGPTNSPLAVHYILSGTAENGVDYETLSGTVTIPAGAFSAPVSVRPIDDFLFEGTESIFLSLVQPLGSSSPYRVAWPGEAVAVIVDNDRPLTNALPAVVLVQPPQGAVFEQGEDIRLVASAWDWDGRVASVEFFDGPISLGVAVSGPHPLPLVTGNPVSPQFTVDAIAFPDWENPVPAPEHSLFHLVWSNAPAGPHELTAVATDDADASHRSAPVTIKVLDTPRRHVVEVKAVDSVATEPSANAASCDSGKFLIARQGPTNIALEVYFRLDGTASNGVDYVGLPTQVTILAGERAVELMVTPLSDE
ncbi:MAG: hypothetical protein HYZ36_00075, partial [Pedosphaera parvula]|nr:hypothetical protein [Pedosphaera parvula]